MNSAQRTISLRWTTADCLALTALAVLWGAALAWQGWTRSWQVDNDLPVNSDRVAEARELIDPNTADVASLARLPEIGLERAKAIVAHREQFLAANPGRRAFEFAEDLSSVKVPTVAGGGVRLPSNAVRDAKRFLTLPARPTTTAPATAPARARG